MNPLRRIIEEDWQSLAGARPSGGMAVTTLPVTTANGPLVIGVDEQQHHHLLVPLGSGQSFEPDTRSSGFHLVRRELVDDGTERVFADLTLIDDALVDVFTSLCVDVVAAVEIDPSRPVRTLRAVVEAWRALLEGARPILGPGGVAGLFGELTVLSRLSEFDPGAVKTWAGPFGAAQDFRRGSAAIEVKTTTAAEGRRVRVHGVDQLDVPTGELWLAWLRLERHLRDGTTLPELVTRVRDQVDDARGLDVALAAIGYTTADPYTSMTRFTIVEERWYVIDAAFPRIVAGSFTGGLTPVGIADVHYTVDLDTVAVWTDDPRGYLTAFVGVA